MGAFSIALLITCVSAIWSARFPRWPQEFRWRSAGPVDGWTCTRILEVADPDTWDDNYFCYRSSPHIRGIGMRWSSGGNCLVNSRSSRSDVFQKRLFEKNSEAFVWRCSVRVFLKMSECLFK